MVGYIFCFERQIWINDRSLEYHRVTSGTTRSYPSPLGNNVYTHIREKPNKSEKKLSCEIESRTIRSNINYENHHVCSLFMENGIYRCLSYPYISQKYGRVKHKR
ncbi:hypothetical protein Hanom_Chr14g01332971 [Helianthus anomalus]